MVERRYTNDWRGSRKGENNGWDVQVDELVSEVGRWELHLSVTWE